MRGCCVSGEEGQWGMSSYVRGMIELQANVEVKDTIVMVVPRLVCEGFLSVLFVLSMSANLVVVQVAIFLDDCPKNIVSCVLKNMKNLRQTVRGVQVSNSNPFDALNSVEKDDDLEMINNLEREMLDEKLVLVDDDGKPLKSETAVDDGYDPYDDDMYDGHDITKDLQAICDNYDIKVRGGKKKYIIVDFCFQSIVI
ncbi:hypothetical protein Tco_0532417 [Tanacetum coccineum]